MNEGLAPPVVEFTSAQTGLKQKFQEAFGSSVEPSERDDIVADDDEFNDDDEMDTRENSEISGGIGFCFVFKSISAAQLAESSRSGANLLWFMTWLYILKHFKIRKCVCIEAIDADAKKCGNYSNTMPSEQLQTELEKLFEAKFASGRANNYKADAFLPDIRHFYRKHTPKSGCCCVGLRATIYLLEEDPCLTKMFMQWLKEMRSPNFHQNYPAGAIPDRVLAMASAETTAIRELAMAIGDRHSNSVRARQLLSSTREVLQARDISCKNTMDPRVMFAPFDQYRETYEILFDGNPNAAQLQQDCDPAYINPDNYGTFISSMKGEYETSDARVQTEEEDESDDPDPDTADDDSRRRSDATTRTGGVTNKSARKEGSRVGFPRREPSVMGEKVNLVKGTIVDGVSSRWVMFKHEDPISLQKMVNPLLIPYGIRIMMCLNDDDTELRKKLLPVYTEVNPINCAEVSSEECVLRYARRQQVHQKMEQLIHKADEAALRKKRDIDRMTGADSDERVHGLYCARRRDAFEQWLDSESSPFRHQEVHMEGEDGQRSIQTVSTTALINRSELIDVVVQSLLYNYLEVYFNRDGQHTDFHWNMLAFWKENMKPDDWDARKLRKCLRDVDPYNLPLLEQIMRTVYEQVDAKAQLVDSHSLFMIMRAVAMNCAKEPGPKGDRGGGVACVAVAGDPGGGKTHCMMEMVETLVPGTHNAVTYASDKADQTFAKAPNNTEMCPHSKKLRLNDEADAHTWGSYDDRKMNEDAKRRLALTKQMVGDHSTGEVLRCDYRDGSAHQVRQTVNYPGGFIFLSNSRELPAEPMQQRMLMWNQGFQLTNNSGIKRGDRPTSEIIGRTAEESLPMTTTDEWARQFWQSSHAVTALIEGLIGAKLLDISAQERLNRDMITGILASLKEKTSSRSKNRMCLLSRAIGIMMVVFGFYHEGSIASIKRALGPELSKLDASQPFAVAKQIHAFATCCVAPTPSPALYVMGTLATKEYLKYTRELLLLYMAQACGITHFNVNRVKAMCARKHPYMLNPSDDIAGSWLGACGEAFERAAIVECVKTYLFSGDNVDPSICASICALAVKSAGFQADVSAVVTLDRDTTASVQAIDMAVNIVLASYGQPFMGEKPGMIYETRDGVCRYYSESASEEPKPLCDVDCQDETVKELITNVGAVMQQAIQHRATEHRHQVDQLRDAMYCDTLNKAVVNANWVKENGYQKSDPEKQNNINWQMLSTGMDEVELTRYLSQKGLPTQEVSLTLQRMSVENYMSPKRLPKPREVDSQDFGNGIPGQWVTRKYNVDTGNMDRVKSRTQAEPVVRFRVRNWGSGPTYITAVSATALLDCLENLDLNEDVDFGPINKQQLPTTLDQIPLQNVQLDRFRKAAAVNMPGGLPPCSFLDGTLVSTKNYGTYPHMPGIFDPTSVRMQLNRRYEDDVNEGSSETFARNNYFTMQWNGIDESTGLSRAERFGEPQGDDIEVDQEVDPTKFLNEVVMAQGHRGSRRQEMATLQAVVQNGVAKKLSRIALDDTSQTITSVEMHLVYPHPSACVAEAAVHCDKLRRPQGADTNERLPYYIYPEGFIEAQQRERRNAGYENDRGKVLGENAVEMIGLGTANEDRYRTFQEGRELKVCADQILPISSEEINRTISDDDIV